MHPDNNFRWATAQDHALLGEIMFDAVRNGESPYTEAQRAAWIPAPRSGPDWSTRLEAQAIIVAEQEGEAVGFMSLARGGYVDFAYVRPGARHRGLFADMLALIEEKARARGDTRLWVHASLAAEPAFSRHGFTILCREEVPLGDQRLARSEMEKVLAGN